MRLPARRSVMLRMIGGRFRVRSRRWVCSCTHVMRGVRRRWYSVSASSMSWLVASSVGEYECVFERHCCALGHVRRAGVGGVSDEHDATCRPGRRHDLLDRGEVRVVGVLQQAWHRVGEVDEQLTPLGSVRVGCFTAS